MPKGGGGGYQIISWNEKIAGCYILKHGALFNNIFFFIAAICYGVCWVMGVRGSRQAESRAVITLMKTAG